MAKLNKSEVPTGDPHAQADDDTTDIGTRPRTLRGVAAPRDQSTDERSRLADLLNFFRKVHPLNRLAILVAVVIVVVAGVMYQHHTARNHELTAASRITDKVIAGIASHDSASIRALGNKDFQASFDKTDLSHQLAQFSAIYGKSKPVIDDNLIRNTSKQQYVAVVYRYDLLKVPFYIRVDVVKPTGSSQWYLQAISTDHPDAPADSSQTQST